MRSIRRSMTLYLIAWSLITVALVWGVMDRVTTKALTDREKDGLDLIQSQYKQRCEEELKKTDESLLNEAKWLFSGLRNRVEGSNYRIRNDIAPLLFLSNPIAEVAWTATANCPNPTVQTNIQNEVISFMFFPNSFSQTAWAIFVNNPYPTNDILTRMHFLNLPLPADILQGMSEAGTDYHQINAGAGFGRGLEWHSESLAGRKLPFDQKEIDAKLAPHAKPTTPEVWSFDDESIPNSNERVRRVIYRNIRQIVAPRFGTRPPGQSPPTTPPGGGSGPTPQPRATGSNPNRAPDRERLPQLTFDNKIYIQCARPKSDIEGKLATITNERDEARATLASDIKSARETMIVQTVLVGLVAILAIALGGPLIVGVGLRPVGKLSDAVSRVSEKDFKLPHSGDDLVQELVPIHSRLIQTLGLLQRAFSREKEQVAEISHELRTPVAALMATIDVTLRKPRPPEQYRSALEECRLISKQLSQLVERIMTLATLDAGTDHTAISRTDAVELAGGCAAIIRSLAAANGISIRFHPPEEMIELDTDPNKLREVLMNLLHNAVEYNRPNGAIDLYLRLENNRVIFEVRDTGIGMTDEIKDKIFERFFRADQSRHATGVHAGLGLAIVKEYVKLLNGTIVVESEPGVGSQFRIALPALPPAERFSELQTAGANS